MSKAPIDFNKIKEEFWKNSDRLDELEPEDPEYDKLLKENDELLRKLR